ncbi:hypothetical protein CVD28_02235 [Bacillus sp. M6-12]|uniref:hypothetical protein n=1 Tax=Bacillus sp. M6-12 TaxID=2054166 RepID=UPI000C76733E|nr:hypothetical protein [Bacillus sp. M6-12]PLS19251.1 hypothetical protein CVD28_02235 [Bacillus sp. M6-12]
MQQKQQTSPNSIHGTVKKPMKASVRRSKGSTNPNRRKMSVSISDSFEEIHDMNQKALKLLAKRA